MAEKTYQPGENYNYPLIIKKLLNTPLIYSPDQEIVYDDKNRYTYRTLNNRINRLASGLKKLGVAKGDIVAVFDYDSHRYLECFFAIPMMGAVLQTINWRLSVDQILYTLNHAEAKVIIIHAEFLPILENIRDKLETVQKFVIIDEDDDAAGPKLKGDALYEQMLQSGSPAYAFPDLDENTKATTFYTTGTTGNPKG
ncbi:MAG: AMP-binding protein, partial [Desulfobacterales bacterium]|nr:AMP-binding protein [Desulfobacterales bacterium]